MNIIQIINDTLGSFELPIYIQGTLGNKEYPDKFFTYWITDSAGNAFYDNNENACDWNCSIIYYTNDVNSIITTVPLVIDALKQNGFIIGGKGNLIPSDEHTTLGWTIDCYYTEQSN